MFKTIVVGHDGSAGAQRALGFAVDLARGESGRIILVHVDEYVPAGRKSGGSLHFDEEQIREDLRRQAEAASSEGVETTVEFASVVMGGPAHAISSIAAAADADLIVCGTRGHSALSGLVLGSVTQRLLHLADRPVLVVPPDA